MDFFLEQNNLIILAIAFVSGILLVRHTKSKGAKGTSVTAQDAIQIANRQHGIFVDIRTAEQFKTGTIAQARNIPASDLEAKSGSLPKNKPIILICDSGQQSSTEAGKLRKAGFEEAVSLRGGLRGWVQDGLPVTKKS